MDPSPTYTTYIFPASTDALAIDIPGPPITLYTRYIRSMGAPEVIPRFGPRPSHMDGHAQAAAGHVLRPSTMDGDLHPASRPATPGSMVPPQQHHSGAMGRPPQGDALDRLVQALLSGNSGNSGNGDNKDNGGNSSNGNTKGDSGNGNNDDDDNTSNHLSTIKHEDYYRVRLNCSVVT